MYIMTKSNKPVKSRKLKSRKSRKNIKRNRKSRKSVKVLTGGAVGLEQKLSEDEIVAIIKNTLGPGVNDDTRKVWAQCIRKYIEDLTYDANYIDKYSDKVENDLYKQAFGKAQWYYNNGECPP